MARTPKPSAHPLDIGAPVYGPDGRELTGAARIHHLVQPAAFVIDQPVAPRKAKPKAPQTSAAGSFIGTLLASGALAGGIALNFDVAQDQAKGLGQALADGSVQLAVAVAPERFVPLEQLTAKQRSALDARMKDNGRTPITVQVNDDAGKRICTGNIHPTQLRWAMDYAAKLSAIPTVPASSAASVAAPLCSSGATKTSATGRAETPGPYNRIATDGVVMEQRVVAPNTHERG